MNNFIKNKSNKNKTNIILKIVMFLFPFLHYYGFLYQGFNIPLIKGLYFLILLGMSFYIGKVWFYEGRNIPYFKLIKYIAIATVFSMVMAYICWGQDFLSSYLSTATLLGIVYYFYLIRIQPTKKEINLLIVVYSVIFAIAWIYGFMKAPVIVFGDPDAIVDDSRGLIRLRIPGIEAVVLCFFLLLNNFTIKKQKIFLLFALGTVFLIFLQLTRQVLFWTVVIGVFYMLRYNKNIWLYLIIGLIVLPFISLNLEFKEDSIFGNLLNLTEQQVQKQKGGDADIRVKAIEFFLVDYSDNIISSLFGNGMPYPKSEYGKYYINKVNGQNSFYLSDVGYGMIYVIYGFVGLILFILLFYKILRSNVSPQLYYAKLYIFYIVLVTIASAPFTNMAFLSVVLYLLSTDKNERNDFISTSRLQFQSSPKIET